MDEVAIEVSETEWIVDRRGPEHTYKSLMKTADEDIPLWSKIDPVRHNVVDKDSVRFNRHNDVCLYVGSSVVAYRAEEQSMPKKESPEDTIIGIKTTQTYSSCNIYDLLGSPEYKRKAKEQYEKNENIVLQQNVRDGEKGIYETLQDIWSHIGSPDDMFVCRKSVKLIIRKDDKSEVSIDVNQKREVKHDLYTRYLISIM